jgi:hypothetical protein
MDLFLGGVVLLQREKCIKAGPEMALPFLILGPNLFQGIMEFDSIIIRILIYSKAPRTVPIIFSDLVFG